MVLDGQTLSPEAQLLLALPRLVRDPAVETLPLHEARQQLRRQLLSVGGHRSVGEIRDLSVDGEEGPIPARFYVPEQQMGSARTDWPLLVFFHGGGMIYGDLDSYDAVCGFLAERAGVRVLSVGYRLAPEHPFPAGVEDCWQAYRWAVDHATELGVDRDRVAVGGDSAGGYLAATTALSAAEAGVPCAFQLLAYPVTDQRGGSESRKLFGSGFYLTTQFMSQATELYLDGHDPSDPRASVLRTSKVPDGLAPAYVVTAGFDPLRDEGEAYARLLADHGSAVELRRFPALIHGFLSVVGAGRESRAAAGEVAAKLRAALA